LCRRKSGLHREAPPPGLVARVLTRDEFIERDRAVTCPKAARRPEIRDATFGRDARARKRHDDRGVGDHLAEPLHAAAKILCNHGQSVRSECGPYSTSALTLAARVWESAACCSGSATAAIRPLRRRRPWSHRRCRCPCSCAPWAPGARPRKPSWPACRIATA